MIRYLALLLIGSVMLCAAPLAHAEDGCQAVAVVDAWPTNDPQHIYKDDTPAGQTVLTDAYADTVSPDGKPLTYAEEGGDDYSAKDLKIVNCHMAKVTDQASGQVSWQLVLDNNDTNSDQILMDNIEAKLEDLSDSNPNLNISEADEGAAAYAYVKDPNSACGKATAAALSGNMTMAGMIDSICQNGGVPQ